MKNKNILIICLLLLIACNKQKEEKLSRVATLPYYNDPAFTPRWISKDSDSLKNFHSIPDFSLVDQDGATITNKTFENKIYITDFFFTTCPGICPKMTTSMSELQKEFEKDDQVLLLSHSVTPEKDSVPVLKAYAIEKGITSSKWHLVTGPRKQIYDLGRKSYFVEEDLGRQKTEDDFLHTENFVLVDKNRHIRGIYNSLDPNSVKLLVEDVKTLKRE